MPRPVLYATPEEKRKAAADKSRRWRERHPEAAKAAKKRYEEKNQDAIKDCKRAYAQTHADRLKEKRTEWRAANTEHLRNVERQRYEANPERAWQKLNEWRARNPDKVQAAQRRHSATYKKRHRAKCTAMESRRRATMLQAAVGWANDFFIQEAYALARVRSDLFGFPWEVDHVVPLNSSLVCGLHVEDNLAVIPATDNLAKSNRWWPNMPE